ncbi:MAG TPA: hypothetical protein VFI09_05855 [Solirubrobacterales bacterium]|nr:hypothetical protein [Solirubrobacterales bacterium]
MGAGPAGKKNGVTTSGSERRSTIPYSRWAIRWIWLFALWLALADSRKGTELLAAAVVAALGATISGAIVRPDRTRPLADSLALLRLPPRRLLRPLLRLVPDTALVIGALWRRLAHGEDVRGSTREVPRESNPVLHTGAGLLATEVWGSLAPNRYVIGVDEERDAVLFHELVRTEESLEPGGGR